MSKAVYLKQDKRTLWSKDDYILQSLNSCFLSPVVEHFKPRRPEEELIIEEEDCLPVSGDVDLGEISEEEARKFLKKLK